MTIVKSRIGVYFNESRCPYPSPFLARGVGFGLSTGFPDNITCGDIYLDAAAAAAAAADDDGDHDGDDDDDDDDDDEEEEEEDDDDDDDDDGDDDGPRVTPAFCKIYIQ